MRILFRRGRIYTPSGTGNTALLIDDTTIVWIGDEHSASTVAADESIDLDDALVTPAFVDAHVHLTATGLALTTLDLAGVASLAEALMMVERAARAGRGRPIIGGGWDESHWPERRAPTAAELDRSGYGGVVYLARVDVHSAVASSSLLANVPGARGLPGYGPDGFVTDRAHDAVRTVALSALTPAQIRAAQSAALRRAATLGIAGVHEMGGPAISSEADFVAALELGRDGHGADVIGYWGELLAVDKARELGALGAGGDLFCDGSLGSHTAALREPYTDRPTTRGALQHDTADIAEHLIRCERAGLPAGFHAIGDAAVDQILEAVDIASERLGRPVGAGHRVEHAEMVADVARFAAAGLTASMQPAFDETWGGPNAMYARRLGGQRAGTLNRFAELAAAGVPLAFGSDSPVTPFGPWAGVRAAAYPHEPGAAISPRAAFTAHTRGGWRAAGRLDEGQLTVGAPATFAMWAAGELGVDTPDERVSRWSTDPRAGVGGLPDLHPDLPLPTCLRTVRNGVTIYDVDA